MVRQDVQSDGVIPLSHAKKWGVIAVGSCAMIALFLLSGDYAKHVFLTLYAATIIPDIYGLVKSHREVAV